MFCHSAQCAPVIVKVMPVSYCDMYINLFHKGLAMCIHTHVTSSFHLEYPWFKLVTSRPQQGRIPVHSLLKQSSCLLCHQVVGFRSFDPRVAAAALGGDWMRIELETS